MEQNVGRKVIAIGDFIKKKRDSIVEVDAVDPESGEEVNVTVRIKTPSPKDSMKIMQYVNLKFPDSGREGVVEDFKSATPEERNILLELAFQYDALLVSSCVLHPTMDEEKKVWESPDQVLEECPYPLFERFKEIIGKNKIFLSEAEAKK
jgi:hypothetical protein